MAVRIFSKNLLRNSYNGMDFLFSDMTRIYASTGQRSIFRHSITKNLEIVSNDILKVQERAGKLPIVDLSERRPLVIILAWILANRKHIEKYVDLYLNKGFDVLKIQLSVKQLLWPTTGSQVVASDAVDFLDENRGFTPLLVHGFSVGGYLWGELLVKMDENPEKYRSLIERIKGQIWDSTPDIHEFSKGFPHAVFPKNSILRKSVEKGIDYHLKTFQDTVTQHYIRSSQLFHTTPVRAPALIFIAKNDPIASLSVVSKAKDSWESMGMRTVLKCWDKSRHVSHFHLHRKEYLETLEHFLASLDELKSNAQDIRPIEKSKAKSQI